MKKQILMLAVSIAVSGLAGCSDVLSKEEIAKLSMKEAATEACKAYVSMNADRIIPFLEEKNVKKTKSILDKGLITSSRKKLEESICVVTDMKEKRRYTVVTFERFVEKLKIFKDENNLYKVRSIF
jgi:hypothetical protein